MYNYTILMKVFIFLVVNGCELIIKKIYIGADNLINVAKSLIANVQSIVFKCYIIISILPISKY